jgi:hypothetical protein
MTSLLVIAGSTRTGSFSKQLARAACKLAETSGHRATFADLRDHAMPLYDGDLEAAQGLPAGAIALRAMVQKGMLNMRDLRIIWTSRPILNGPFTVRRDLPQAFKDDLLALRGEKVSYLSLLIVKNPHRIRGERIKGCLKKSSPLLETVPTT